MSLQTKLAWPFLAFAVFQLGLAVWQVVMFFVGPPWDASTDTGNIQYHDTTSFVWATMSLAVSTGEFAIFFTLRGWPA